MIICTNIGLAMNNRTNINLTSGATTQLLIN
jgi:hypothetical protein